MKLVMFSSNKNGNSILGALTSDNSQVVDMSSLKLKNMMELIQGDQNLLVEARECLDKKETCFNLEEVTLLAPVSNPDRNIFCVGKNYVEHAAEFQGSGFDAANKSGPDVPEYPIYFTKAYSTITGPGDPIPASSDPMDSTDYEGELTVVIGKKGRNISREQCFDHIFGYTIINDVTSRGLQKQHNQWFLGKNIDGFCPMGPAVVTSDEVPNINSLKLTTHVNGELRQTASLDQLIFDIPELISTLSKVMTLYPGDLIATGTPAGVGAGYSPPKFLHPGDEVKITIEPIGVLSNPVL